MPTMHTIEEHEAQQVKPYIDVKIGAVGNVSGDPKTVSYADIVSIKDAIAVNAKDVSIKIEPVQAGSGTPSPDNIRAISGWSSAKVSRKGKNLLASNVVQGSLNTQGAVQTSTNRICTNSFISVRGGETYTINASTGTGKTVQVYGLKFDSTDVDGTAIGGWQAVPYTFTLPETTQFVMFMIAFTDNSDLAPANVSNVQIEAGSTATDYEPYIGNEYTIDLGGTIYGGTLDVTSGVLTIDRKGVIFNGTQTIELTSDGKMFYCDAFTDAKVYQGYAGQPTAIMSCFKHENDARNVRDKTVTDAFVIGSSYNSSSPRLGFSCSTFTTVAEVNTFFTNNPQTLVYELATPQVIQLTPTQIRMLAGVNTVYANTGDTQVEYFNASVGNLGEVIGDVQAVADYAIETGVKNLLPDNGTSQTIDGVTFTVNSDGSVTANGTATATIYYRILMLYTSDKYPLTAGKQYKLSGCPEGGGDNTYKLQAEMNGQAIANAQDVGNGSTFTAPEFNTRFAVYIRIPNGYTISNKLFKPMITDANIPDSDYAHYQPYAKTNVELTQDLTTLGTKNVLTSSNMKNGATINGDSYYYKFGKIVVLHLNIRVPQQTTGTGTSIIAGLPSADGVCMVTLHNNVNDRKAEAYFEGTSFNTRGTLSDETVFQQTLVYTCT